MKMNSSTTYLLFGDALPLAYINAIKAVVSQEKYFEFSQVMKDYRDGRIDTRGVKASVKELFKGNSHLILGFNNLMPKEYQINIRPLLLDDRRPQGAAAAFIHQVKVEFKDNTEKYSEFIQLMRDYKYQRTDLLSVVEMGIKLFRGHTDLLLEFSNFLPDGYKIELPLYHDHKQGHQLVIKDAFLNKVKLVFQDNMEIYFQFLQVINDHKAQGIDIRGVVAIVKELFKGHTNLILEFNAHLPKKYKITLPPLEIHRHDDKTGKKVKKVENCQFPWDLLDIISKTLDFDDLFEFACVCKNWRAFHKMYWRLEFQEPLLVHKSSHVKKLYSFTSIPNQRVYHSNMINYYWHFAYSGSSSGYLIMTGNNNSFLLINPFTRKKKVINTSTFKVNFSYFAYHVLLAFGKGSKEFVLLALCNSSNSLHVYQSRNVGWVTYSNMGYPWKVVDFVVLHYTIYVVTDKGNIGVLNLNSTNIKFLKIKSTPSVTYSSCLRLIICDGQLFVVHTKPNVAFNVYKIDFSTMNYVKLKTLGGIALFFARWGNYHALSNPDAWGYESNSVYVINHSSTECKVYLGDDNKLPKYINYDRLQTPPNERPCLLDWCFRHLHYEVDYSLVE